MIKSEQQITRVRNNSQEETRVNLSEHGRKKVGTRVNKGGWNRWNNGEPDRIFGTDKKKMGEMEFD